MQVSVFVPQSGEQLQARHEVWLQVQYDKGDTLIDFPEAQRLAEVVSPGCTNCTRLLAFHPGNAYAADKTGEDPYLEDWYVLEKVGSDSTFITNTYNAGRSPGV